jgi:hypothetical protein
VRPSCHVCRWPIPDDELLDPLTGGRHDGDRREVVLPSGMIVRTCVRCWTLWPARHKRFPAFGYGRTGKKPTTAELVELLREAA